MVTKDINEMSDLMVRMAKQIRKNREEINKLIIQIEHLKNEK